LETLEQVRDRLVKRLIERQPQIDRLYAYYRGDHPLPWAPREVIDAYRAYLQMSRSNWCRLVVKAPAERLRVTGIKFSGTDKGDVKAWERYWQGNQLDLQSRLVHDAALVARRGFVLVWPSDDGKAPQITPEHPSQVIVDYAPGCAMKRRYGLKLYADPEAKMQYATVWSAQEVANWEAPWHEGMTTTRWVERFDDIENIEALAENPVGEVPLVEFVADCDMLREPMGELDGGVLDIQDRINKTILDRLVTSNFSSFKQRWVTGMEIPKDKDGNDVEPFKVAVNRLWMSEDPEAKFGEFGATDLDNYIKSVEADIQHLAAITRTPPHYLLGQSGAFPSGESLKATETGLVAKVLERRDSFTESWETVMRLALKVDGDERADDMAMSMVWKDPESRSLAEIVDAAVKLDAIGLPFRAVMEVIGYTPTEIDVLDTMRAEDVATGLSFPPAAPTLAAVPPPALAAGPPAPKAALPAAG
jgi:hypothetical protein